MDDIEITRGHLAKRTVEARHREERRDPDEGKQYRSDDGNHHHDRHCHVDPSWP